MNIRNTLLLAIIITMVTGCGIDGKYLGGLINISGTNTLEDNCSKCAEGSKVIPFNWGEVIPSYMHYTEGFDYEQHFPRYLAIYYPEVWKRSRNDEFAFRHAKEKYLPIMKQTARQIDASIVYMATTRVRFGEYNLEGEYFPIVEGNLDKVTLNTGSTVANNSTHLDVQPFPRKFHVKLTGTERLVTDRLSINKRDAEQMILVRKDQFGTVNRTVLAHTYFKIVGTEGDHFIAQVIDVRYQI